MCLRHVIIVVIFIKYQLTKIRLRIVGKKCIVGALKRGEMEVSGDDDDSTTAIKSSKTCTFRLFHWCFLCVATEFSKPGRAITSHGRERESGAPRNVLNEQLE